MHPLEQFPRNRRGTQEKRPAFPAAIRPVGDMLSRNSSSALGQAGQAKFKFRIVSMALIQFETDPARDPKGGLKSRHPGACQSRTQPGAGHFETRARTTQDPDESKLDAAQAGPLVTLHGPDRDPNGIRYDAGALRSVQCGVRGSILVSGGAAEFESTGVPLAETSEAVAGPICLTARGEGAPSIHPGGGRISSF